MMPGKTNRRRFLQTSAAAGVGFWVAGGLRAQASNSANEQIQFASVGVDGKGRSDSRNASRHGAMVGICDVDSNKLKAATALYPDARKFADFREMLDALGDKIDAVTVSTPDHNHAAAAAMAMRKGKHVYCQKPMTHSIYEARKLGEIAREKGVITQMGNQGTSLDSLREGAAVLRTGALGAVSEVHIWTNRPIWKQGIDRPEPAEVPDFLNWELWIGTAPMRPYTTLYHPFSWRGWWDFGTGALGDMACHTVNLPFMGLDLRDPTSVQAVTSGHNRDSYPQRSTIEFEFPANDWRGALKMVWYDDKGNQPPAELFDGKKVPQTGALVIGEKGKLLSAGDYGGSFELMGVEKPKVEWKSAPQVGNHDENHMAEFAECIKSGEQATSNFPDYAGPLTETILLGNLAVWVAPEAGVQGQKVEWDAKSMTVKNIEGLEKIVKPPYREGYTL